MLSERIQRLSDKVRNTQPTIDLNRARLFTEYYSHPSMDNYILRRAKAFRYYLENREIFIDEDSWLAGHQGGQWESVVMFPESTKWLRDDFDTLDKRPSDHFQFRNEEERQELREIVEIWNGQTTGDFMDGLLDDDMRPMLDLGLMTHGISQQSTMNHSPDYDNLIKRGYRYYINECKKNLAELNIKDVSDFEKRITWESMIIVMEAVIAFSHRYADLAEKQAAECKDEKRKAELLTMADNCRNVPENPPRTFLEAAQFVWMNHLTQSLEAAGGDHCLGRFDQYMYPFWQNEKDDQSEEYFQDIIHELKLKVAEMWNARCYKESVADPGNPLWMHIILGGVKENGKDACNEVTRIFLRAMRDLQTDEPCITFRYHPNIDEETFRLAIEVARDNGGHPAFYNDTTAITYLLGLGFTLKEARNWGICGCIEPHVLGKTDFQSNPGYFNPIKILDLTLHNGYSPEINQQIGPKTGDPTEWKSIEDVKAAFKEQIEFFMERFVSMFNRTLAAHAHVFPTILGSCFSIGCMEKGRLLQNKGSDHHYSAIAMAGFADVVDSLEAMDKCVFQDRTLTMKELIHLLDTNFEGAEDKRQMLINRAPKFGNDIEEVDEYSYWVIDTLDTCMKQYKDAQGGPFTLLVATQAYNVEMGKWVGATPNGRLAFTPLADNVSPSVGMDTHGPTAVVNSLACCDELVPQSGLLLNQRFDPAVVAGEKGLDIIETVFRAHFNQNGYHIQINVFDDETLRAAQKDPDSYRNILVRVAGYSAYFVDLSEEVQNNIIERTIQTGL